MFLNKGYRKYTCINCCSLEKDLNRNIQEQAERIKSPTHSRREVEACESIIKSKNENEKKLSSLVKDLQTRCQEYTKDKNRIETLIQNQFFALETKLVTQIEEKMNTATHYETKRRTNSKKSYADAANNEERLNIHNMKQLIRREKIEEQIEDQRKISKDDNIIVHGVKENENTDDHHFVNQLLNDLNVNTQPNYVGRIGNESNRTRPIKVVFKDSHVKYRFMKRLKELKQHDKYSNMSITDDMTRMERDLVKEWKKKANERNQRERNKDYVWRVRGSSREGLYLKKIHCRSVLRGPKCA